MFEPMMPVYFNSAIKKYINHDFSCFPDVFYGFTGDKEVSQLPGSLYRMRNAIGVSVSPREWRRIV